MKNQGRLTKLPKGWLNCPANGEHLIASRFMALKTPLSEMFDTKLPEESRYPPKRLFHLAKRNKVHFGLWIDLTNTNRYYCKEDIEQEGCKYLKIQLSGHGETPSKGVIQEFNTVVQNHITEHPSDCIAVHCTHGFNRTGFLITAFLVEKLQFNVKRALEMFAESRPPGIYRENYIRELFWRYGRIADTIPTPLLPKWVNEKDHFNGRQRRNHR